MPTVLTPTRDETATSVALLPSARRCLVTGAVKPKDELVRFVLDPEGLVVPDVAGRLPGRGLWVSADAAALSEAVRKNLFSRAAKAQAKPASDLPEQVERLLARRCLNLLGLARAAGAVVMGQLQVEEALSAGSLEAVMLASDAGKDIRKKLSRVKLAPSGFTRDDLGAALGRDHSVTVGLRPHPLTQKLQTELARWQGVRAAGGISTDERLDSDLT